MIELTVRFWTNDISPEPGKIVPKHAWTSGVVNVRRNDTHGLSQEHPIPFRSLLDLGSVIEQVLIEHEVVLHLGDQMKRYTKS